jgi:hypothetical protein
MILVLEELDGLVTETKYMIEIAKSYYKDLFGREERRDIRLRNYFYFPKEKR